VEEAKFDLDPESACEVDSAPHAFAIFAITVDDVCFGDPQPLKPSGDSHLALGPVVVVEHAWLS
jgi:hypothetical protein